MNDDDLGARLHAAVPEPPDPSGWADTARRTAGRRRAAGWPSAGVTAVIVALVGGMLWTSGSRDARVAVPAASPSVTTAANPAAPAQNPDCTDAPDSPAGSLREHVVRITLCPRTDGPTFTTPLDSLTTGTSDVIRSIAALPAETSRDPDCSDSTDRRYRIIFIGARGQRTSMDATAPNTCGIEPRSDNGGRWAGLLTILREAWAKQRATRLDGDRAIDCLPWNRPGLFTPQRTALDQGAVCVQDDAGGRVGQVIHLSPELLRKVAEDVARNTSRAPNRDSPLDGAVLTLAGAWGDPLVFWRVDGRQWYAFVPGGQGGQLFWKPGPEAEDALQYVLQSATTPTATPSPADQTYLPKECRGLTVSSGAVPTSAQRLRLCPTAQYASSTFTPLMPLMNATSVLGVVSAQERLPQPAACTADYGPDFLLVAETDGKPPVVMNLQLYGCRVTGTKDDPRTGADEVLAAFKAAQERMRTVLDLARPLERPEGMCRRGDVVPVSVMPIEPSTASYVYLCRYSASGDAIRQSKLGDADARRILQDVGTNTSEPTGELCLRRMPASLVLTDPYADALVLVAQCGDTFVYTDARGDAREWTPSARVRPLVKRLLS